MKYEIFSIEVTCLEREYRAAIAAHKNAVYNLTVFDALHKTPIIPKGMSAIEYNASMTSRRASLLNEVIRTLDVMKQKETDFTEMVKSELTFLTKV